MKATCPDCPVVWYGLNIAHCSVCHETFSIVQHFDAHRSQAGERGACIEPGSLKFGPKSKRSGEPVLKRDKRGFWVSNSERPEALNDSR